MSILFPLHQFSFQECYCKWFIHVLICRSSLKFSHFMKQRELNLDFHQQYKNRAYWNILSPGTYFGQRFWNILSIKTVYFWSKYLNQFIIKLCFKIFINLDFQYLKRQNVSMLPICILPQTLFDSSINFESIFFSFSFDTRQSHHLLGC